MLVPFYRPNVPLESTEKLYAGFPWTWWFRAAHAFSGRGLLGCTMAHVVETLLAKAERSLALGVWWRAVMLLPVLIGALLGGFVLRGDAEATAALNVWRGVLETVPVFGRDLAVFLLGPRHGGVHTVALHHVAGFTILFWIATAEHAHRLWPDVRALALALLLTVVAASLCGPRRVVTAHAPLRGRIRRVRRGRRA